jgi:hypothetical protein
MASDVADEVNGVEVPLACSLTEAELRVRGEENGSLFARAQSAEELPDGYRFTFSAEADDARSLLAFILAERACCPFFTFELTFPSPHEPIQLAVRGREGVKEIVRDTVASTAIVRGGVAAGIEPRA